MSNGSAEKRKKPASDPATKEPTAGAGGAGSSSGSGGEEAAKSQEEIRHDIEQTREELGDTVDALSQKADVKAQMSDAVDEQKEKLRAKKEEIKAKVSGAGEGGGGDAGERVKTMMNGLVGRASRNPLPYVGGAAAAGLLVGLFLRGRRS